METLIQRLAKKATPAPPGQELTILPVARKEHEHEGACGSGCGCGDEGCCSS